MKNINKKRKRKRRRKILRTNPIRIILSMDPNYSDENKYSDKKKDPTFLGSKN